jgi:hypothetical protein
MTLLMGWRKQFGFEYAFKYLIDLGNRKYSLQFRARYVAGGLVLYQSTE